MDVVVIGGGIIGLATAWRLAQRKLRVAVWEQGETGKEASWAGAGMLAPGGEMEERSWWGDLAVQSLRQYPEFVRELEAESGLRIDYRACGALERAATEESWERLKQRAARQASWGIAVHEAGDKSLFYPDDAAVDPRDLLRALVIACQRLGVCFRGSQTVRGIMGMHSGGISEPESAGAAVLAAGAWSSSIPIHIDGFLMPVETSFPVRGHLVSFAATGVSAGPILRQDHTYILQRSSGIVIAGSTTEQVGFRREPDPKQFADIEQRARALAPELCAGPRLDAWIGFRPSTSSGEPQLGRLADSPVYLAYGHYRNGILMAPATADLVAGAITANSQTDLT